MRALAGLAKDNCDPHGFRAEGPQYDSLGWSESDERRPRQPVAQNLRGLKGRNQIRIIDVPPLQQRRGLCGFDHLGLHPRLSHHGLSALCITSGSPWENASIESFHDKLRDECLNREISSSLWEARVVIEQNMKPMAELYQ